MSERYDRSPLYQTNRTNSRENVARQSRREACLEGSRLPTYRRSRSAANLTVSSLKGKQSLGIRSSSSSKNIQNQHIFFGSTQKPQSQRPRSSVFSNKFLTPISQSRLSRASGSANRTSNTKISPWLKSDNIEVQKKELAKELNRIRQVLTSIKCATQLTKPIIIREFVSILIHFFDVVEIELQVTFANYVTMVPVCMKLLNYTGNCSTSFLKSVNTMHNWPHILNIFSYLCDAVEAQCCAHPGLFDNCKKGTMIFRNIACRVLPAKGTKKQELYGELTSATLQMKDVDVKDLEMKRKVVEELLKHIEQEEEILKEIQTECFTRRTLAQDIETKKEHLEKSEESTEVEYETKIKSTTEQIRESDLQIVSYSDKKILVEEPLKAQTYTRQDVFHLHQEKNDLEETNQLLEERNKKMETDWDDDFLELSKINGKVKAAAIKFNARLKKMSLNSMDEQIVLVPEFGFSQYSKEEFGSVLSECVSSSIHDRIAALKENMMQLEKECEKNLGVIEDLEKETSRISTKNSHKFELQKRQRQEFDKKLEIKEKILLDIRVEIISSIDETDESNMNIKNYEELGFKLDKKIVQLEHIFKMNQSSADKALKANLLDIGKFFHLYLKEKKAHIEEKITIETTLDEICKTFE